MNGVFSRVGGSAPHTQGLSLHFKTQFVWLLALFPFFGRFISHVHLGKSP